MPYLNKKGETVESYFCTRPRLASMLMSKGYKATPVTNPYDPERAAWTFPADDGLLQIVSDFYTQLKRERYKMHIAKEGGAENADD